MEKRIPSLDGARALSVMLVAGSHVIDRSTLPLLWRVDYGNLGVRIFFVISGFLITALLLKESEQTGTISLSGFYVRRLFRIMPVYYVFLAVVAALIPTGFLYATYGDVLAGASFVADYIFPAGTLGNTWSLAVEEQFYLVWPVTLLVFGVRRSLLGCAALLVATPLFRVLADLSLWPTNPMRSFECVSDALACGCILACLRERLWALSVYRRLVSSPWVLAIPLAPILIMAVDFSSIARDLFCIPILNVGIALTLDRYTRIHAGPVGRVLNYRLVAWIGTISYSAYLWQQLFFFTRLHMPGPLKMVCALGCAAASYYAIEQPALTLRRKLQGRKRNAVKVTAAYG